jgi:UDP-glucose 4-epimerase
MRVLVTGSSGFIGSEVVTRLRARGYEPVPFDKKDGHDVRNRIDVAREFTRFRPQHVIHLAGMLGTAELFDTPHEAVDVNVHGALNVIEESKRLGASLSVITMPRVWDNVYQATKGCADSLARAWYRHKQLSVSFVCAYNAFGIGQAHGPGHPQKIIPTFATMAWQGKPIPVWGDGTQLVDLVHAPDIAETLVRSIPFGNCETFDAGTGAGMTVNDVVDLVRQITGSDSETEYLPMREGEHPADVVAKGRGWDELGWHPAFQLSDLVKAVESYR